MNRTFIASLVLALTMASPLAFSASQSNCCDASKCKTACCKIKCCDAPCCANAKIQPGKTIKHVLVSKKSAKKASGCCSMPCCNDGTCCSPSTCCVPSGKK